MPGLPAAPGPDVTFGEWLVFHVSCGIVQAACIVISVALADEGRIIWAVVAGAIGLVAAHVEGWVSRWA